ncbi:hypothetical protein AFI02nite_37630 [Aliivibrio fischeri]|uniref:Uncharacterized protein n=1 Tax=Aliivibrio fischeri TaxID=668 RepID=A0A510UM72_ALIFS|nr:hypothetical protein AFI02nite_37630 [Aliivibrio fischeri]
MIKCYVRKNDGSINEAYRTGRTHKVSCKVEGTCIVSRYVYVTFTNHSDAKEYMFSDSNILSEKEYMTLFNF